MVSVLSLTYALPDQLGELCGLLWRVHLTVLAEVIRPAHCGQNQGCQKGSQASISHHSASLLWTGCGWLTQAPIALTPPLDPKARISLSPLNCFCQCFIMQI